MKVETRHFGELEVEENKIIRLPEGLLGFEEYQRFILVDGEDQSIPFQWLQSLDCPELAFVVMDPFLVRKDYEFELPPEVEEELGIGSKAEVTVLGIVVLPEDLSQMTVNLTAPLIINMKKRIGKQVVLDDPRYTVRHYILEELRRGAK